MNIRLNTNVKPNGPKNKNVVTKRHNWKQKWNEDEQNKIKIDLLDNDEISKLDWNKVEMVKLILIAAIG